MKIKQKKEITNSTVFYPYSEGESASKYMPKELLVKIEADKDYFSKKGQTKRYFINNKDYNIIHIGKIEKMTMEQIRQYCSLAFKIAKKEFFREFDLFIWQNILNISEESIIYSALEGIMLTDYQFDKLLSKNDKNFSIEKIDIIYEGNVDFDAIYKKIEIITDSIKLVRDLINYPANIATIDYIEDEAKKIAKKNNLEIRSFSEKDLIKDGFNLIYAVGKGGSEEPRLIEISYKAGEGCPNICLVGKGIIFDSGGLNLKPDSAMADMKEDMSGSAIVLGIIKIVSELKLKINLTVLMPLAENAIDGNSMRPSDVITAYNKKTVEILNTDAEGRLILADALSYSDTKNYDLVMDFATLTGAAVVALGTKITAAYFRGAKYKYPFIESSVAMSETVWELPLFEDYKEMMKSSVADIANLATPSRQAGSIMAALFLGEFIKNENWIHLDIAGTSFADKESGYNPKGGIGVMIRTTIDFLTKISN